MRFGAVMLAAGASLCFGLATGHAQTPAAPAKVDAPPPAPAGMPRVEGYLGKDRIPNSIAILPPPPVKGSTEDRLDNETYANTRALAGSPRWALATKDATQYVPAFDCPLGLKLESGPPEVLKLFSRVGRDASAITNLAKDHFDHPRPFIAPNGPICTENDRAGLMKSFSYPSGHTTYSWAMGLVLAELAPERATEILARARAFGESRVVCGVHTVSDIEEGRTNGSALVAVLHSDPAFRADMEAAKTALHAAMAAPHAAPDAGQCKVEADAEAHTPWINPTGDK
jgi:acid phosphatase (class A)